MQIEQFERANRPGEGAGRNPHLLALTGFNRGPEK